MKRRQLLAAAAGASAWTLAGRVARAATARVVVVGGGFAGLACARALRRGAAPPTVTLVEPQAVFEACPLSNLVLTGLRDPARQRFDYRSALRDGVELVAQAAVALDPVARSVRLTDGRTLHADRLVVAPGIELRWDTPKGYDQAAAERMPHAWRGGEQIRRLREQLLAMADGGLVVMAVPTGPYRCPPAPYERAGLLAHWLATHRPHARLLVLDAKDSFPHQSQFLQAWRALYGERLRWVPVTEGGGVVAVDPATLTVETDFDQYAAAVANVIPPQGAGRLAIDAGLADRTGWCPVDALSFESRRHAGVHVIGDAAWCGPMPKSATAAVAQARVCAAAVLALLDGRAPADTTITTRCSALFAPDRGIVISASFRVQAGEWSEIAGSASATALSDQADAAGSSTAASAAADSASREFDALAGEVFG